MFGIPFGAFPVAGPGLPLSGRRMHPAGVDHFRNQFGQFITFATDDQASQSHGQPATSDAALRELPTIRVTSYDIEQNDSPDCVICLEPLVLGEQANRIPCGHLFHESCIKEWLRTSNQCPVCRYELPTDDAYYEQERQSQVGCRRPRLRRADLAAKSVRELRHLARHLGVSVVGCIEKDDLVQRLVASGAIDLICNDETHERPTASASVPDACKVTSTQLSNMSFNEIRYKMIQLGVDFTGCHQKRDLIQRLIDAGRVAVSGHGTSKLIAPSERRNASELQCQRTVEVAPCEDGENLPIALFRHGAAADTSPSCVESSMPVEKEYVHQQGHCAEL